MTIRSMHGAATGEMIAKMKMKALSIAFSVSFILRVVSQCKCIALGSFVLLLADRCVAA